MDHDLLGGVHMKRAIKYSFDKLEGQKLIGRCAAPADYKGKGRKPIFYEATGTNVPGKFTSRTRGGTVKPPVKKETPSPGTDLNNNPNCQNAEIVKTNDEGLLTKPELLTKPIVVKTPSPGTDLSSDADNRRHRVLNPDPELEDWGMWD